MTRDTTYKDLDHCCICEGKLVILVKLGDHAAIGEDRRDQGSKLNGADKRGRGSVYAHGTVHTPCYIIEHSRQYEDKM